MEKEILIADASQEDVEKGYVEFIGQVFSTSSNVLLKQIRNDISLLMAGNEPLAQKEILQGMLLKILRNETLAEQETALLERTYLKKKRFHKAELLVMKDVLSDLLYTIYDFHSGSMPRLRVECMDAIVQYMNPFEKEVV